jgi:hypothetical protein
MDSFNEAMQEYRKQLEKGQIQQAYKGLMDFMLALKTHFKDRYPDYFVSGSLYFGYMDMTYFALIPEALKQRNLKIALVFNHQAFRFEAWLAGYNKQVQTKYWQFFKTSGWKQYALVPDTKGEDAILVHVLAEAPDFGDLAGLTRRLERETLAFILDIENYLSKT